MPPQPPAHAPPESPNLLPAYVSSVSARGRANKSYVRGARAFFTRWPDPQEWARQPLALRLATAANQWSLRNYLMYWGHLRPGYD